jgi:hypothetical protein
LTELLNELEEKTLPGGVGAKLRREVNKSAETTLESDPDAAWKPPTEEQLKAAERVEQVASQSDISVVRTQVLQLAREYERLRAVGVAGDQRRRWQVVVIKMRALARAAYDLLPELADSESSGERLAAIAILQVRPNPDYLDWLAKRVTEERPFIGYQAAEALRAAVRNLGPPYYEELRKAIQVARNPVGPQSIYAYRDRDNVLEDAEKELEKAIGQV